MSAMASQARFRTKLRHDRAAHCRAGTIGRKAGAAWSGGFGATCCASAGGGRAAHLDSGSEHSLAEGHSSIRVGVVEAMAVMVGAYANEVRSTFNVDHTCTPYGARHI
jgi:hypothetical protein